MKQSDLSGIRDKLHDEVMRRRGLGGFSTDAEGILLIAESLLAITNHLLAQQPKKKSEK